jgi:hypothetical protein
MIGAVLGLIIATIVVTMLTQAELRRIRQARNLARAQHVAELAALFDLFVHQNRVAFEAQIAPTAARGKRLSEAEETAFEAAFLSGTISPDIAGFDVDYLVGYGEDGTDVTGQILLTAVKDPAYSDLTGLLDGLEASGLVSSQKGGSLEDRLLSGSDRAAAILGRALADEETAILTPPLSGLPEQYILREARAGHLPPVFTDGGGVLDMATNDILNGGRVAGDIATATQTQGPLFASDVTGALEDTTGNLLIGQRVTADAWTTSTQLRAGLLSSPQSTINQVQVNGEFQTDNASAAGVIAEEFFGDRFITSGAITGVSRVLTGDMLAETRANIETGDIQTVSSRNGDFDVLEVQGQCTGC